ncbi:amyloid-beta A4 precursor protein-binding family A member 1 isoform X2 [Coregonus clupeaformis]|uniref:amyloid-beta A4 precursor protein-binding family A member 1 isoform X2 n=1 Tax=Coregonus clupeaformis TaxID=59861 RepID=UPI001BE0D290|nr:amyloid-beta A4 precursor protein-binding family A member 1 isoform X2 [Coregonus clupeaformis]
MSHKQQGEGLGDYVGEEQKAPAAPKNRQPNGTAGGGGGGGGGRGEGVPVRRSWRPCQMLGQDGQDPYLHHHHHHHPPIPHQGSGRGPPRHRRRSPSGQGLSRQGEGVVMEPSRHTQPPRPGVARYRRQGVPRVRVHRQRQPPRDVQETHDPPFPHQWSSDASLTVQSDMTGPAAMKQQHPPYSPPPHHTQASGASDLTAGTLTPTHHTPCPPASDLPPQELPPPLTNIESPQPQEDEEEGCSSSITQSVSTQSGFDIQTDLEWNQGEGGHGEGDLKETSLGEEDKKERDLGKDNQEDGTNGHCSDTDSAASLSMEAPPLSPPPHQSPPTSPSLFSPPPLQSEFSDQCSDEFSPSPTHDTDIMPDDESCTDSPLSHSESFTFTDSYPKTYAEFYNESYPQSESITESYTEPYAKSYPQSFPEPLKLINYPDRELHRRSEADPDEPYAEPYPEPYSCRQRKHVYKGAPDTEPTTDPQPCASWPGRDVGLPQTNPPWQGRSVGSRLHHYDDTTSDGEADSLKESPRSQSLGPPPRNVQGETQSECPSSGQLSSGELQDEQAGMELRPPAEGPSEDSVRGSGNAISLAIRDIREAIEEVKTKTVRSPYTPDQPIEPVWVMRQEVSPTEEENSPQQPPGGNVSSPSRYTPVPVPDTVPVRVPAPSPARVPAPSPARVPAPSPARVPAPARVPVPVPEPVRAESSRTHQVQHREHREQREPPRPPSIEEIRRSMPSFPTYVEVPGPCDPEDLIDGIIFAASYLGSTHLLSERTPTKTARMQQAQEAMSRVRTAQKQAKNRKKTEDEVPSSTEVDLFMSTQRIKVLNTDTQESMMDLPLRTISYIADIGNMVVLMARGKMVRSRSAQENLNHTTDHSDHTTSPARDDRPQYRMVCHVFESEDAQLIAQSIGQAFSVAYQEFLRANGIDPEDLSQREYSDLLNTQDMYNDDLIHFSKSENCRDVYIEKQKGEMLGVVIVESGWGSILPTVIIASMMHSGPAEKSGRLNIGDQIMTINGTSLVGLPLSTCQSIIKGLKAQCRIKLNIVRCPPVTMVLIRRPDLRYQLGFSVQNGIICSLMRGGIAERGGVRVGHRIIEINGQSVVATPHEKIVHILSNAVGEIHMKTMPAAMYRLLTAQEQPVYI